MNSTASSVMDLIRLLSFELRHEKVLCTAEPFSSWVQQARTATLGTYAVPLYERLGVSAKTAARGQRRYTTVEMRNPLRI
jgi:hypothetical protein